MEDCNPCKGCKNTTCEYCEHYKERLKMGKPLTDQHLPGVDEYIADHPPRKQQQFQSGMKRNDSTGKPRFDLICPLSQDYDKTLIYRWAMLLTKGMEIYSARNWEQANGLAELESFKASAERHFRQAMAGDITEDHFAAVLFNLNGIVYLMDKLGCNVKGVNKSSDS